MTPKEKAKELYEKMYWHFRTKADSDICEQCALIAVDEIIKVAYWNSVKEYWQEVKEEIEKL